VQGAHTGMLVFIVSFVVLDVLCMSVVFGLVFGVAVVVLGMAVVVFGVAVVVLGMAVVVFGVAVVAFGAKVVAVALNSLMLSRGHIKIE